MGTLFCTKIFLKKTSPRAQRALNLPNAEYAQPSVWLTPRAARDQVVGWSDDVLRLRVSAPPVEDKANVALAKVLAKALGNGYPTGAIIGRLEG